MTDQSHLDLKYFVSHDRYNCPFCNRRHVVYGNLGYETFNWSNDKVCAIWRVKCGSCTKISMHLTFTDVNGGVSGYSAFKSGVDLDAAFFYSVPTSFFVIDDRIPRVIRELISEAEGCVKMNYVTGASACARKAIYELLAAQKCGGANYDDKIKALRDAHAEVDATHFEVLGHVKDVTSDHVHEESWEFFNVQHLKLAIETLKAVLHELYVVPDEQKKRAQKVRDLHQRVFAPAKTAAIPPPRAPDDTASDES